MASSLLNILPSDKEFFSIGEISQLAGVKPYVLRYWESQFAALRPARRNSGQRKFTRRDVEVIMKIRELLYERRYTIEGAKKYLRGKSPDKDAAVAVPAPEGAAAAPVAHEALKEIKEGLAEIVGLLRSTPADPAAN
jgi:DNA-binding transcriptional MerR regulator